MGEKQAGMASSSRSLDRQLDILCKRERRRVLQELLENDGVLDLNAILDGTESGTQRIAVVHSHLPKLADAGYVEWDRANEELAAGPAFEDIAPLVELLDGHAEDLPVEWP